MLAGAGVQVADLPCSSTCFEQPAMGCREESKATFLDGSSQQQTDCKAQGGHAFLGVPHALSRNAPWCPHCPLLCVTPPGLQRACHSSMELEGSGGEDKMDSAHSCVSMLSFCASASSCAGSRSSSGEAAEQPLPGASQPSAPAGSVARVTGELPPNQHASTTRRAEACPRLHHTALGAPLELLGRVVLLVLEWTTHLCLVF